MKKYWITFSLALAVVFLLALMAGCGENLETSKKGKFIGAKMESQKRWLAVCVDEKGKTFGVSVYRYEKKICGDRKVDGNDLFLGRIKEGPLPGYEKEWGEHFKKEEK